MKNQNINLSFVAIVLACFALLPTAQAVSPAPDGGYANGNTAEGTNALFSLTSGHYNTAGGFEALYLNTTGNDDTANGFQALFYNTTGQYNTAIGEKTLFSNTTGGYNTASGANALYHNTNGDANTANGLQALFSNTGGQYNTANGFQALFSNTSGNRNTATGESALYKNAGGLSNTATGAASLYNNTAGIQNTATGDSALGSNTSGSYNTANGLRALLSNTTGDANTAVGYQALYSNTTGHDNTAIGISAGFNQIAGSHNVYIGSGINGTIGESNTCRIASIFGQTAASGSAVFITSGNKLGTSTSSKRFKEDIKPMDKASEALLALKPVTFRYKKEIDPERIPQFGLVAEEVEEVNPDLVVRDETGKPYSVRYDQVNAMLLNEFLKERRQVEQQQATITQLKRDSAEQQKQIEALTAGLQRVSDRLELSKPATKVVSNRP